MVIYTKEQYDEMMKPIRDEIRKANKGRKPIDLDSPEITGRNGFIAGM